MSDRSRDWDERDKRRNEPSKKFYAFCFGLGLGFFAGMTVTLWSLLG